MALARGFTVTGSHSAAETWTVMSPGPVGRTTARARPSEVVWVEAVLAGEADPAEAGLAEVVPAGPGEVADEVRVVSAESPQRIEAGGRGFGADDDPVEK